MSYEKSFFEYCNKFPNNFVITPGSRQFPNPGNVSSLHKKTRDIIPRFFDGVQISCKTSVAPNKTLLANWVLSHTYPSGFRIGGIYNWKCVGNILENPIIEADINPSTLSTNLSFLYHPVKYLRFEAKLQALEKGKVLDNFMNLEYIGKSDTFSLSTYNASKKCGRLTLSYLRTITSSFSVGTEFLVEWVGNELRGKTAFAGRYSEDKWSLAASLSAAALDVTFWSQINRNVQFGSSFVFNKQTEKSIGAICYHVDFIDTYVRGYLDSDLAIGFTYNRTMKPIACSLALSLVFCLSNNKFGFGFGINMDPGMKC